MSKTSTIKPSFQWDTDTLSVCVSKKQKLTVVPVDFDTYLYLTPEHWITQTSKEIFYFFLFRINETNAAAMFQCVTNFDQNWVSPARAPFGGIQCDSKCTTNELNFLLQCIEQFLLYNNSHRIIIKTEPSIYNSRTSELLTNCYHLNGYVENKRNINHSISVIPGLYADLIHHSEIRRLKKCKLAGFTSGIEESPDISMFYNFLQLCRSEKNYSMSLTFAQFEEMFTKFPEKINVFTIKHDTKIIALAVTVQVNQSIIYNFLVASRLDYNQYSPAVMLTEAIYIFCQNKKIPLLDLGISLDHHGNVKEELIRFKQNIGGIKSYKVTFEKIFK